MVDNPIYVKGRATRFNPRRHGPVMVIRAHDNNTITIIDAKGHEAVLNVERCRKIRKRPKHLIYDDKVSEVIDEVVRGPDSHTEGRRTTQETDSLQNSKPTSATSTETMDATAEVTVQLPDDSDVSEMIPLRRSKRQRRQPDRYVAHYVVESDELDTETQADGAVLFTIPDVRDIMMILIDDEE
jgi:hypothetical protein